ncbi:MAG: hypothetical protein ABIT20_12945 [Gemmatimonadaceae bacterium]
MTSGLSYAMADSPLVRRGGDAATGHLVRGKQRGGERLDVPVSPVEWNGQKTSEIRDE